VVLAGTSEAVLLEELVDSLEGKAERGPVEIVGGPRTGKTTALSHLASLPFANQLYLVDDAEPADIPRGVCHRLIVYATCTPLRRSELKCELVPWCDDDLIEYLLSTHPDRCSAVMTRFMEDRNRALLSGQPELCRLVAEELAASVPTDDIRAALRRAIAAQMPDEQALHDARFYTLAALFGEKKLADQRARQMVHRGISRSVLGLLKYPWIRILLTADWIVTRLKGESEPPFPRDQWPRELVQEVAECVAGDQAVIGHLQEIADSGGEDYVPMAASVLHVAVPQWRPDRKVCAYFSGAYLSAASWEGIELGEANLERADLSRAKLRGANLTHSELSRAILRGINLVGARLADVFAIRTDFHGADLSQADLSRGRFTAARFTKAILNAVSAAGADFQRANLNGASFCLADLRRADFRAASLVNTDFQDANLQGADLSELVLKRANLRGADLSGSDLRRCDLEGLVLPSSQLKGANLAHACLTGTVMHGANFRIAKLRHAGLAEVDWEGADLRDADLRGCSFHLGSSRSGLVGSPYPGHGSRTGFYTNDFDDQSYKPPEAIRKANLCGADLRGARVEDTDFYLVDLRGALYDAEQAAHFRRCDAILVQ
jgi:uncharacterized protein YjbI with pentapeptide repeats